MCAWKLCLRNWIQSSLQIWKHLVFNGTNESVYYIFYKCYEPVKVNGGVNNQYHRYLLLTETDSDCDKAGVMFCSYLMTAHGGILWNCLHSFSSKEASVFSQNSITKRSRHVNLVHGWCKVYLNTSLTQWLLFSWTFERYSSKLLYFQIIRYIEEGHVMITSHQDKVYLSWIKYVYTIFEWHFFNR